MLYGIARGEFDVTGLHVFLDSAHLTAFLGASSDKVPHSETTADAIISEFGSEALERVQRHGIWICKPAEDT